MSKNKITVRINGKEFTIIGIETQQYMEKVADYIDKKITEIALSNSQIDMQKASVLAAINVTDDYFKSIQNADNLRSELGRYIEDSSKDKQELALLRSENERLRDEVKKYQSELSKLTGANKKEAEDEMQQTIL